MSGTWFIIFCGVELLKGQWWHFLTRKCTVALLEESRKHTEPAQLNTLIGVRGWHVNVLRAATEALTY